MTKTKEKTIKSSDLEQKHSGYKLSRTVTARLLALATSPNLMIAVGPSLPLLAEIIMQCGENNDCEINLIKLAKGMSASHSSLKLWLRKLAETGFVITQPIGNRGVRITLNTESLPLVDAFYDAQQAIIEAEGLLQAIKVNTMNAVEGALHRLESVRRAA